MKLHSSVTRLIIGSALSLTLLLLAGIYSYHFFSKSHDAEKWVNHTRKVLTLLESIHTSVALMENNQRGFLLTQDATFLDRLAKNKFLVQENLTEIENTVVDNISQQENLKFLKSLIATRTERLQKVIETYKNNPEEGLAIVKSGIGHGQMNSITEHISKIREIEVKLLNARLEEADAQTDNAGRMILFSIFLVLISVIGFAYSNFKDLSHRLKVEANLRIAEKEALSANKAKSDFLANMSHEIRTPMNAIIGMADLLVETPLTPEQKKYVQIFQRSGQGLLTLINDILDLSKVEAGQLDLDNVDFAISEVLDQVSELVAIKAHQKNLEFVILIEPDLHEYYIGDPNRIRQAILNLVNNSIKFTEKGEIVVSVKKHPKGKVPNHLLIEVIDTGIGMTPEQTAKVFERFTQADEKITTKFGGTGLGLSITKKLVELMGGTVSIESKLGLGTTLSIDITLPLSNKEFPLHTPAPVVELKDKRALIVDDNSNNRLILRQILTKHQVKIEEAENGTEAIAKVEASIQNNTPFDFILLDGRMPDIDGFTVAERLKEKNLCSHAVLMMLTSDQRAGDIERSKHLGIKGYLVKPISYKEFNNKLNAALIQQEEQSVTDPAVLANVNSVNQKILVVDDNSDNRTLIEAYLKGTNFKLFMAENGLEAVNLFKNNKFDHILMDIQMPVMDGLEATKKIRSYEKEHDLKPTLIFALSAYALKEEKDKSLNAGYSMHLSKPIKKADLIAAIKNHLETPVPDQVYTAIIDPDLKEMAMTYLEQRRQEVSLLKKYLEEKDFKNLNILGHKMRGVAESYGFTELTQYGGELELAAKATQDLEIKDIITKIELYLVNVKITDGVSE